MITSDEILEKLHDGLSIEQIGQSISAVLNIANQQFQKEQEEKKAAKEKLTSLASILGELFNWYEAWYKDLPKDIDEMKLAESIIETCDVLKDFNLKDIANLLDIEKDLFNPQMKKNKRGEDTFWRLVDKYIDE